MSFYAILFGVGGVGLLALALMGMGHGAHHGGDHGGHHVDGHHFGGHHSGGHHGGGHHGGHHSGDHGHHGPDFRALLGLVSPIGLFAMALGAGAAGLLFERMLGHTWMPFVALAAALAMNLLIVRPLFRLVLGFAATPAAALEGTLAESATAASRFDEQGRGVVRLTVDGQTVRLLARLEETEIPESSLVVPGDQLLVTEVDAARNAYRVTRL